MFKMKKTSLMVRCALQTPALVLFVVTAGSVHADLPVRDMSRFWSPNVRIAEQTSNYMRIVQDGNSGNNWILNWQSFDVSAGNRVQFVQPSANHIALNRIWGGSQSLINGQIDANGRIYLINQNGFLFGATSRINVNSLVASSLALNITDDDFINNHVNLLNVVDNGGAAFINGAGAGRIEIAGGASITTADGGNVLIIAPEIINGGDISTRSGQVILAAARDSVYLTPSYDPSLRGFLVELGGTGGKVKNAGTVLAERGNITLAGLAINQDGILQATSSIYENGSIRLLARDQADVTVTPQDLDNVQLALGVSKTAVRDYRVATNTENLDPDSVIGDGVTLGGNSQIEITPDQSDTARVVDEQAINKSRVEITGHDITMESGARIMATGGEVLLHTTSNPQHTALDTNANLQNLNTGYIELQAGSHIDVSGSTTTRVAMERNQLEIQLTGDFLSDSPLQREGVLRNEHVLVDIREGTPLGDISADVSASIKRDISERLSTGGTVDLLSQGGVVMHQGSEVNITGGAVTYDSGYITTSRLVTEQGQTVGIAEANPDLDYRGLFGVVSLNSKRWGSAGERRWSLFGDSVGGVSRYHAGYTEGQAGGSFNIQAHAISGMADVAAGSVTSALDRTTVGHGGSLNIKTSAQDVQVLADVASPVLEDMLNWLESGGTGTDPVLQLDDDVFASGLGSVNISGVATTAQSGLAGGELLIADSAHIAMAPGASFSVNAGSADVRGNIDMAGGKLDIKTVGETRVSGVVDVSGNWVNDNPFMGGDVTAPVAVNGGSISIAAGGLTMADDAALLANGGAWWQANGDVVAGEGGDISLASGYQGRDTALELPARMEAFGINAARGGKLSLNVNRIRLAQHAVADETGLLQFTPDFFTQNGFADYSLTANQGELVVAAGSVIEPRANNLQLDNRASFERSGANVRDFSHEVMLDDSQRAATSLTLAADQSTIPGGVPADTSALTIEQGAAIHADAGANVKLSSASRLFMLGDVTAHGGDIELSLAGFAQQQNVLADQVLWVDGTLDVSGTFIANPVDDSGLRTGRLLDGGNIRLTATDGFVVATDNSRMNVSGIAVDMDLPSSVSNNTVTAWSRQTLNGDAGSISVRAAEGVVLAGDLLATGASPSASGGRLSLALDANSRRGDQTAYGSSPQQMARQINLVQALTDLPAVAAVGADLDVSGADSLVGQAWVAADAVAGAGFDHLQLQTASADANNNATGDGVIHFRNDLTLSLRQSISLNAPVVTGNGQINLDAAYVHLGSQQLTSNALPASAGTGNLMIHADGLLDISGDVVLRGIDEAVLHSGGDLRARGTDQQTSEFSLVGSLQAGHNLSLTADQVYATTFSDFDFTASDTLNISGSGAHSPVLSAGSSLNFNADVIHQGGVVKAPLGEVQFNADTLDIQSGSLTSVATEGQTIPFGIIKGEQAWVYGDDRNTAQRAIPNYITNPPDKRITLNADNISMADDASFDISGGGDLYAWEHVPGLGGSHDNLLPEFNNGAFAVLPGYSGYAAYDEVWWQGVSGINMGDQVYLSASPGLAAGVYTLLPARYALLPGAMLVTPTGSNLLPTQQFTQLDGSAVVAGQRRVANTPVSDQLWSGFVIENGNEVRSRSEYFERTASQFFRDAATRNNTVLGAMPEDAGALDIIAVNQLTLAGELRGGTARVSYVDEDGVTRTDTGRGSQLNIAGDDLRVVNAYDASGGIQLLDDALNDFGAASLLLGGSRSRTDTGTVMSVSADRVTVEADASLAVPDVILAARSEVTVASGAHITATGEAGEQDEMLIVNDDGALLRASSAEQALIDRNGSSNPTRGVLNVASGARISAETSMILDASLNSTMAGSLVMEDGSLNLGASRISLGDVTGTPGGLVLDATDLNSLHVNELVLTSRSSVDIHGDFNQSFNHLVIDAAALNGYQGSGENVILQADSVRLGNAGNASSDTTPDGVGNLTMQAGKLELATGNIALRGFNTVNVNASEINLAGSGALDVGQSDLTLDGRITAGTRRAQYHIGTDGNIITANTANITVSRSAALAAGLSLAASEIEHGGVIDLASGDVNLLADNGDVVLADGSQINVSGIARDFAGDMRYSQGGDVELVATQGSVMQQTAAEVNVSGGGNEGKAGGLRVSAVAGDVNLAGELLAQHGARETGGRFELDAQGINNVSALNAQLNNNGFNQQRHLRMRAGDFTLAADEILRAQDVLIAADAGDINIAGEINARNSVEGDGGEVTLAARGDVNVIAGAIIDAGSNAAQARGGDVFIETREGMLNLAAGAEIDVSGSERGGKIHLRAPRNATNNGINVAPVAADMRGYARLDVEGFRSYEITDGVLDMSDFADAHTEAEQFMSNDNILSALKIDGTNVHLRPGVEFNSDGDLTVHDLLLSSSSLVFNESLWMYENQRSQHVYVNNLNTEAGVLSIRAGGNLILNGSVSDGVISETSLVLVNIFGLDPSQSQYDELLSGESWSYRLVAGADSDAAYSMTTSGNTADLILQDNQKIRTGTGDIDIAVADDLIMNNGASIYTAGENTGRGSLANDAGEYIADWQGLGFGPLLDFTFLPGVQFPEHGGDVTLAIGGDVDGNVTSYLSTDWLQRVAIDVSPENTDQLITWGVDFRQLTQGIAAFGGGDVRVTAGGDVSELALYAPVTGRQTGQVSAQFGDRFDFSGSINAVELLGGGDITLQVGGDLSNSLLHADRGEIQVDTGGNIGNANANSGLYLLLADTQAELNARGDIYFEGAGNVTQQELSIRQEDSMSIIGAALNAQTMPLNYFSTLSEYSGLSVNSLGGDIAMRDDIKTTLPGTVVTNTGKSGVVIDYPASLSLLAMDGNVNLTSLDLAPSSAGQLAILAQQNIGTIDGQATAISMSTLARDSLSSWQQPDLAGVEISRVRTNDDLLHQNDRMPARIIAMEGSIAPLIEDMGLTFNIPKAVELYAGKDLVAINLNIQHFREIDVSILEADRDFRHVNTEQLSQGANKNSIRINGPGEMQIIAGRNIELGNSEGIESLGNTENGLLPESGANILLMAGANSADYQAFINRYFVAGSEYEQDVIAFLNERGFAFAGDQFEQAMQAFGALDEKYLRGLVVKSYFNEINQSAQRAAQEQNNLLEDDDTDRFGYSRGLDAIAALFPDSVVTQRVAHEGEITNGNVIVTGGFAYELNSYSQDGDISMVASNITTRDDDSRLSVLAPGGMLNVGLTVSNDAADDDGNIAKPKGLLAFGNGDMNIYTLGDIAVNQSRIQALNGGNMTIWSTLGDIDAGKGAKSQLSLPEATMVLDFKQARIYQVYTPESQGSGIRGACFDVGCEPGTIVLAAPGGLIDAGDAGINSAGNLILATDTVLNAGNIEAGGDSVGFSADTAAMGLDLGNLSPAAGDSTSTVAGDDAADAFSNAAVAILQVEVMGLSDEDDVAVSDR